MDWTYEDEDGSGPVGHPCVMEFSLECRLYPGEPMVMYYPNGDGYPGSPDEVEILSAVCLSVNDIKLPKELQDFYGKWFVNWVGETATFDRIREAVIEGLSEPDHPWDDE
jgi:hypothetical protein